MSRSTSPFSSPASPSTGSPNSTSPSVPYVPTNLSPAEQAIDGIAQYYAAQLATVRGQALEQLKAEKAAANVCKDAVALGVFKRFFRELLDIQLQSTVLGDLATVADAAFVATLADRCRRLLAAVNDFQAAPTDRKGARLVLSGPFQRFIAWFLAEVQALQAKIKPGGGSQATIPPAVAAKAMEDVEAWYHRQAGRGRGGGGGGGGRSRDTSPTPSSASDNYTPTS